MVGDIRHIFVIQSLPGSDRTGRDLYNDTIERGIRLFQKEKSKMACEYIELASKKEFVKSIKEISKLNIQEGILFHLEMHGNKDLGLRFRDNSDISWTEIIDLFRPINIYFKNKLFITMAVCEGRFRWRGICFSKFERAPFCGYISASKTVNSPEILEDFSSLFEALIKTGNLITSYYLMENKESKFYYKDLEGSFNEGYEIHKQNLISDPSLREEIIGNLKGAFSPDGIDINQIFDEVLIDLEEKIKKAFFFE